ncbi:hypothetical protein [Streptomyces sp. LN590]|uniref:hypothetical protein n=1 Tax=Streptomyces sp. LN590 TaxID=3112980 RepID=UPI00371B4E8C
MARRHTSGFEIVGMDDDPTPGDIEEMTRVRDRYRDVGDKADVALKFLQHGGTVDTARGAAMDALRKQIGDLPEKLKKTADSFHAAADAYTAYAPQLTEAQDILDQAMDRALSVADQAGQVAPEPPADATDEQKASARQQQDQISQAQGQLSAAKSLAQSARELRQRAQRSCEEVLDEAAGQAIPERNIFQKIGDFFKDFPFVQILLAALIAIVAVFFPVAGALLGGALFVFEQAVASQTGGLKIGDFLVGLLGIIPGAALLKFGGKAAEAVAPAVIKAAKGAFSKVSGPIGQATKAFKSVKPVGAALDSRVGRGAVHTVGELGTETAEEAVAAKLNGEEVSAVGILAGAVLGGGAAALGTRVKGGAGAIPTKGRTRGEGGGSRSLSAPSTASGAGTPRSAAGPGTPSAASRSDSPVAAAGDGVSVHAIRGVGAGRPANEIPLVGDPGRQVTSINKIATGNGAVVVNRVNATGGPVTVINFVNGSGPVGIINHVNGNGPFSVIDRHGPGGGVTVVHGGGPGTAFINHDDPALFDSNGRVDASRSILTDIGPSNSPHPTGTAPSPTGLDIVSDRLTVQSSIFNDVDLSQGPHRDAVPAADTTGPPTGGSGQVGGHEPLDLRGADLTGNNFVGGLGPTSSFSSVSDIRSEAGAGGFGADTSGIVPRDTQPVIDISALAADSAGVVHPVSASGPTSVINAFHDSEHDSLAGDAPFHVINPVDSSGPVTVINRTGGDGAVSIINLINGDGPVNFINVRFGAGPLRIVNPHDGSAADAFPSSLLHRTDNDVDGPSPT